MFSLQPPRHISTLHRRDLPAPPTEVCSLRCKGVRDHVAAPLIIELGLNSVEQGSIQNGRLFARKDLAFIDDLADVEPVTQ